MSTVMDVRSGVRATLLALAFLWVGTSLPHIYSTTRAFFLESLPSILSAAMAPRCLFLFSNIIVAFLVGESKLSRRRGELSNTDNVAPAMTDNDTLPERKEDKEEEVMAVTEALLPSFNGANNQEQENNMIMVTSEDVSSSGLNQGQTMDQCGEEVDHLYQHQDFEVQGAEGEDDVEGEIILGEDKEEEEQETDLPPADELNRRVEDFIARFNMERQLEAKMLVCCY